MAETSTIDRITERHLVSKRRRDRTRLRPTPSLGWYGGALFGMGVAAYHFGSNPAWMLTFLLAGGLVAGAMQAWRRLAHLQFAHGQVAPVPAGRPASLPLNLANPGPRPAYGVLVAPTTPLGESADQHVWLAALIPPRGDAAGELLLPPLPRGIHKLPELAVSVRWPLGLVEAGRTWRPKGEIVVHPMPRGIPLEQAHPQSKPLGSPADGRGQDGDDFDGLRPYRPGDSPRHVHWKAAARGVAGDPPVKVFSGSAAGELVLDYADCGGDAETRLGQLARWVEDAFVSGRRFALALPGSDLPSGMGEAHRLTALRLLARWQMPGSPT